MQRNIEVTGGQWLVGAGARRSPAKSLKLCRDKGRQHSSPHVTRPWSSFCWFVGGEESEMRCQLSAEGSPSACGVT